MYSSHPLRVTLCQVIVNCNDMNTLASNTNAVAGQGIAAAASLIMFLPNLILFICMQSKVMNTMAYSGLK